ncbi:MAG: DUF3842 family protein [Oscillospiraceae bacterium]|nr:DUF3842 family protein [Oscillospiraceae bacterium]
MKILVIDGMGGGIGKAIIEHIRGEYADIEITAVGTNAIATTAMLKAGASNGATGENALLFNSKKADCIIGVVGIIIANSMHGEISPKMAKAVSSSSAHKILVPIDKCGVTILGLAEKSVSTYVGEINSVLKSFI